MKVLEALVDLPGLGNSVRWVPLKKANEARVKYTIEAAFQEELAGEYFNQMREQGALVCFVEGYKSVGVFIPGLYHVATLATHPKHSGNDFGEKILNAIEERFGKWNLRSKPSRIPANRLYRRLADRNFPATAVDGVGYEVYLKKHSPWEAEMAGYFAAIQPSHFKK